MSNLRDPRFAERNCPCCGQGERRRLFDLPAAEFCRVNWSYVRDYATILGLTADSSFPVAGCVACGFVYAELQPSNEFLAALYDRVIMHDANRGASETRASVARRMHYAATLLELVSCEGPPTILDFGCGLGATLRLLSAAGVVAIGYDPSRVRDAYARAAGMTMATSYDELRRLGPFDAVVCDNVLEHMPMPGEAIALLWSVTRPGAVLYVSVPNHDEAFIALQSQLFSAGRSLDMSLNPWEHLNYFDLAHLDGFLARGGFQPVARTSLPGEVRIGVRAEADVGRRIRNSLASALRLVRYAMTMQTLRSVNEEFYVRSGSG